MYTVALLKTMIYFDFFVNTYNVYRMYSSSTVLTMLRSITKQHLFVSEILVHYISTLKCNFLLQCHDLQCEAQSRQRI